MRDAVSLFCCNNDNDITDFITNKAVEYEKRDKCRTYIYLDENYLREKKELRIIGFFSIAIKTLKFPVLDKMSKSLYKRLGNLTDKEQNLTVYLIGQLGRDSYYSNKYLDGKQMLNVCYDLIQSARYIVGGRLILVECKPVEKVCAFYEDITEDGGRVFY